MHAVLARVRVLLLSLPLAAGSTTPPASTTTTGAPTQTAAAAAPFSFIAIGCMPYARLPGSETGYGRVLAEINRHAPVFAVHLGDIMGGEELCTDELLNRRLQEFDSVATAMVFTPGDNEWTDVHRTLKYQPLERLNRIREVFFANDHSRGQRPIPLVSQRRSPVFAKYVENVRWSHGNVLFATVHVVGSGNNRQPNVPGALEEWSERDQANAAWIRETMNEARTSGASGVALFCQANPIPDHPGFALFLETLATECAAYEKPVLLLHADEHRYRLESGFRPRKDAGPIPNLTRVETFGASDFHAVLVTVDPTSAAVFLPGPLIVPGNPLPRLPRPAPPAATKPAP
jgi:hypothetical protein